MKIKVFGQDKRGIEKLNKELKKHFVISNKPDIVISYGGDGTFFLSERVFPGVPKLLVRHKGKCFKCSYYGLHSENKINDILLNKRYKIITLIKLEAITGKNKLVGVNDIIIRNKNPNVALRFSLKVDNKTFNEIIGDGIVIATPMGSTGYFNSITGKHFENGIGIAFNNPIYKLNQIFTKDNAEIELKILREEAVLAADNNKKIINLKENDVVIIRKSKETAKIIKVKDG